MVYILTSAVNQPNAAVYALNWTRAPGRSLSPGCAPVGTWLVVAGWLNYPVATINYTSH